MPINTDLSVSPYNDDYSESKNFHRVLFKPDVAVQTREMNQLQNILQNQIERFGNNIFKRGTVIDGVNFIFYDIYPYVKIKDVQINGFIAIPENYEGYFVKNENGLRAYVINSADGFESTDPDLKTLYLKYINSGASYNETTFTAGQILTAYDSNSSIYAINITSAGSNYSNSDIVVTTPVLLANVTSGLFAVGDVITNPITGAKGSITSIVDESTRVARINLPGTVAITTGTSNVIGTSTTFLSNFANGDYVAIYSNTTSYATKKINVVANNTFMNLTSNNTVSNTAATYANTTNSRLYISYRPIGTALSNVNVTSDTWTFSPDDYVIGSSNTNVLDIVDVIGENAAASIGTDAAGRILTVTMTNRGNGYERNPIVSIQSQSGVGASLAAQNFYGQVTISSSIGSVGSGYAFGVTDGIIYQKGNFIRVDAQTIVVDKYSKNPDNVTVGFVTNEEIIDANIDTSLFDNVSGYSNINAPGADRLKLTPVLTVSDIDDATDDSNFFNLVEWSNGYPYKQNNRTFYNVINDQAAEKILDINGNFVVDKFLVTTATPSNTALIANTISIVVDPGTAYVDGYKVQTLYNYEVETSKSISTKLQKDVKVSLNYENYLRINNVGGLFEFDRGNLVSLYDTPKGYLFNSDYFGSGNTTPSGTLIGTARIRNFMFEQGTPGTPNASYRLYVFNVNMSAGKNLQDIRSIYYDGVAVDGIGDTILENNGTANVAVLYNKNNKLLFDGGVLSPLNANSINYVYRTIDDTAKIANTGLISISLVGPNKVFPYTGTLSDSQKTEIYLSPSANLIAQANLTGTVNVSSTSTSLLGNATAFQTELKAGQYIYVAGGGANNIFRRVVSVTNNTVAVLDSNSSFTGTAQNFKKGWPNFAPINLSYDPAYTANVSGSGDVLTINIGSTLNTTSNTNIVIAYNVSNQNIAPTAKTVKRNQLVKLSIANNAASSVGPWCLGVPDIFRMRNVYIGNSSVSSVTGRPVTDEFFVDHNQNSNYYDLGFLYKKTDSSLILTNDDYLLVEFDCFTASPGFFNITSYVSSNKATRFTEDSKPLANLTSTVNTFEIPEVFDDAGNYYDLINQVDFRPYVDATANITSNTALITLNPANTVSFSSTDRFFPVPGSIYENDIEYFTSRIDAVVLDGNRNIRIVSGVSDSNTAPSLPAGTLRLNNVSIPSYPSIPQNVSNTVVDILNTRVHSNKYSGTRINDRKISTLFNTVDFQQEQPTAYTQKMIGSLDRRISTLEYYITLNLIQAAIKNRVIPSSLDSSVDRFKYGFFVDDYDDATFSETASPEYKASIANGFAVPLLTSFNTVHTGDKFASSPYTSIKLVSQTLATDGPIVPPKPIIITYIGTMIIEPPYFKSQTYTKTAAVVASSGGGGKIVCTAMNEMYGFGSFRNAVWIEHSATMAKEYEIGYHKLFLPVVNYVYRSEHKDSASTVVIRNVIEHIARHRTADIWKAKRGKVDMLGRIYRTILEPICYVAGKINSKKEI